MYAWVHAKLLQSCPTLCNPMDCSPPGSSVHEILQARILEWTALPSSRRSSRPRDQTHVSYIACISRRVLYHSRHLGDAPLLPSLIVFPRQVLVRQQSMDRCPGFPYLCLVQSAGAGVGASLESFAWCPTHQGYGHSHPWKSAVRNAIVLGTDY